LFGGIASLFHVFWINLCAMAGMGPGQSIESVDDTFGFF